MKKILCLSDGLMQGGAERQLIGLAHLLKDKGYDVTLACYTRGIFYENLIQRYSLKFVQLSPKHSIWSKLSEVHNLIKVHRYDWVIAYKDGATMISCILKMIGCKYRLIVSERNTTQTMNRRERLKFWLYKYADAIVPNSHAQEKFILSNYPEYKKKVIPITNFTDTDTFIPIDKKEASKSFTLLTVGRVAIQKNVLNYLKAIKTIHDKGYRVMVKWIGDISVGQENYYNQCISFVEQNHMHDYFYFEAAKPNIKNDYDKCDVFCLPSNYEGFPNVVCEAMACGKPVICSNVCDNPYIVEDGINGYLFDPSNVDDIMSKIELFLNLPESEKTAMCKNSRKIIVNKCSEATFVQNYINIIENNENITSSSKFSI